MTWGVYHASGKVFKRLSAEIKQHFKLFPYELDNMILGLCRKYRNVLNLCQIYVFDLFLQYKPPLFFFFLQFLLGKILILSTLSLIFLCLGQ